MECSDTVGKSLAQDICKKLEHFAEDKSIPSNLVFSMDHALAEYLQNLVDHSDAHHAHVAFEYDDASLRVIINDDGKPYNILEHKPVDFSIPFAEREIGGLGIHMIRKMLDHVNYESSNGWNTAVFCKQARPS